MTKMLPVLRQVAPARGVFAAEHLAELARQALVAEAELTPKPGLVDRRGSGSHDDLSFRPYAAVCRSNRSLLRGDGGRCAIHAIQPGIAD